MFLITARDSNYTGVVLRSTDNGVNWQRFPVTGTTAIPGKTVYGNGGFIALPYGFGTSLCPPTASPEPGVQGILPARAVRSGASPIPAASHPIAVQVFENAYSPTGSCASTDAKVCATWQATRFPSHGIVVNLSGTSSGFVLGAAGGEGRLPAMASNGPRRAEHSRRVSRSKAGTGDCSVAAANGGILEKLDAEDFADLTVAASATSAQVAPGATMAFDASLANAGPAVAEFPGVGFAFDAVLPALGMTAPAALQRHRRFRRNDRSRLRRRHAGDDGARASSG